MGKKESRALDRKVEAYIKDHPTLSRYRYGYYDRFLQWVFGGRATLGFVWFYVLTMGLLTYLHFDVSNLGPIWLIQWKPEINGQALDDVINGAMIVPITVVAGVLTVVAIAVTILATMISTGGSRVKQQAFFAEANPVGVVTCGLVLLAALVVHYLWPVHGLLDWIQPDTGMQFFRLLEIVVFFAWTILTILGALHLLKVTFEFARPTLMEATVFRYLVNAVLPKELRQMLQADQAPTKRQKPSPGDRELVEADPNRGLATEQVLEDLLSSAGRLAIAREIAMFGDALALATNVHRFLLLGYTDFSAENQSPLLSRRYWLDAPVHMNWVRSYAGLLETTVESLPGGSRMVGRCAGAPDDVLRPIREVQVPDAAVINLLALHAYQNHAVGRWIRTRMMPGSDNTSLFATGDRESLRRVAQSVAADRNSFIFSTRDRFSFSRTPSVGEAGNRQSDVWDSYAKGWNHLVGELTGLASLLGAAVHYGNWPAAEIYCDLFNRRRERWEDLLGSHAMALHSGVDLLPDQVGRPWSEVNSMVTGIQGYPPGSPAAVFERLLRSTLKDVQIALSALLLRWAIIDDGQTALCRIFLNALMEQTLFDQRYGRVYDQMRGFNAKDLLFSHLRIRLIEALHPSQGERILNEVAGIDSVRGESVISLEVFHDDTIREFWALSGELLALLTAAYMTNGDRLPNIGEGIRRYVQRACKQLGTAYQGWKLALDRLRRDVDQLEEAKKPDGDQSLRRRCELIRGEGFPRFEKAIDDLQHDLTAAIMSIEKERALFESRYPIDRERVHQVAGWAQAGIRQGLLELTGPLAAPEAHYGGEPDGSGPAADQPVTLRYNGFTRAAFTTPTLIEPSGEEDAVGEWTKRVAAQVFWNRFWGRNRRIENMPSPITTADTWTRIPELIQLAGRDPVLLLPVGKASELLRWVRGLTDDDRERLGLGLPTGTHPRDTILLAGAVPVVRIRVNLPVLVSRRIVERIDFPAQADRQPVQAFVEPADAAPDANDTERLDIAARQQLLLKFNMRISWTDDTIIELRWPEATTDADDETDPDDDVDLLPN